MRWTIDEEKYLEKHYKGCSREMSKALGKSRRAINAKLAYLRNTETRRVEPKKTTYDFKLAFANKNGFKSISDAIGGLGGYKKFNALYSDYSNQ